MSLEKFVEEKISEAIENGEFENLKNAGKPLNLDTYFNTPAEFRAGYSLLKSNNFVPEEVELLKEIGSLKEKIRDAKEETQRKILSKQLNEKMLAFSILSERNKRK